MGLPLEKGGRKGSLWEHCHTNVQKEWQASAESSPTEKKNIVGSATKYLKKQTHIYNSNKLKRGFFDRM